MLDMKALVKPSWIGTIIQVAMVVVGHFSAWISHNGFMWGGLGISLFAGFLYGREAASGYAGAALGGAIVGGLCALIGIAVSVLLGDTPANILLFGTIGSAVTGLIGGVIGKLTAGSSTAAA